MIHKLMVRLRVPIHGQCGDALGFLDSMVESAGISH